ncbi:MAG TPA: hypothetical protein VN249_08190, partial [Prolixibacteraceae bacterium]|nr:hypothetical protein [Prolixibacteraceae bacterium]
KGLDVLIICALRKKSHISHLNLQEALDLVKQIAPKFTYLTHMSHEMGSHADLQKELPEGVEPAYDGLVIEI